MRPLNSAEKSLHNYSRCLKQDSANTITWILDHQKPILHLTMLLVMQQIRLACMQYKSYAILVVEVQLTVEFAFA
jgi:hypothetical protein